MIWLAVRYKEDNFLFVQSRIERENQNSVLIDEGKQIETIVVKSFDDEMEAVKYCKTINTISGQLDDIFN